LEEALKRIFRYGQVLQLVKKLLKEPEPAKELIFPIPALLHIPTAI
jgi:hypothetical protein